MLRPMWLVLTVLLGSLALGIYLITPHVVSAAQERAAPGAEFMPRETPRQALDRGDVVRSADLALAHSPPTRSHFYGSSKECKPLQNLAP